MGTLALSSVPRHCRVPLTASRDTHMLICATGTARNTTQTPCSDTMGAALYHVKGPERTVHLSSGITFIRCSQHHSLASRCSDAGLSSQTRTNGHLDRRKSRHCPCRVGEVEVGVGVRREADVAVPHELLGDAGRDAVAGHESGEGVAEAVNVDGTALGITFDDPAGSFGRG